MKNKLLIICVLLVISGCSKGSDDEEVKTQAEEKPTPSVMPMSTLNPTPILDKARNAASLSDAATSRHEANLDDDEF